MAEVLGTNGTAITQARNTKSRAWCFTLNNYTDLEYNDLKNLTLSGTMEQIVLGKEIGESKTPHIQGCIKYKNPVYFEAMKKKIPRANISQCRNWHASVIYCKKDRDYWSNTENYGMNHEDEYKTYMIEEYNEVKWYQWQEDVLDILKTKPSKRKLYWIYEEEGNKGKSFLAKYIDWKHNAIIANGKQGDIFNQYKMFLEKEKKQPKVAIIDIPRSHKDYVCYSTLEKIKDGLIYSGKYEGGKLRLIPHHLIVFANFEPDRYKLSEDRWEVKHI